MDIIQHSQAILIAAIDVVRHGDGYIDYNEVCDVLAGLFSDVKKHDAIESAVQQVGCESDFKAIAQTLALMLARKRKQEGR